MKKMILVLFSLIFVSMFLYSQATDLFISEYMEGSSNNKAFEIFNGTGAPVDLADYMLERCNNGALWGAGTTFTFDPGVWIITDGDVWVNVNSGETLGMTAVADSIGGGLTWYNGDDSIGLFKTDGAGGWTLIDVIGENGVDPGSYWPVAGVYNGTQEHTLVRKSTVTGGNTDWTSSSGTNTTDSEWIVYPQNNFDNLGSHTFGGNALPLITNVVRTPAGDVTASATVSVSADIIDPDGTILEAILWWGTVSGSLTNPIFMLTADRATYTTENDIPAQPVGTTVYYEIEATDNESETTTTSEYDYTVVGAATTTIPYVEEFGTGFGDCYTNNVLGATKEWQWYSSGYPNMNGYNSGETEEDWLILPGINMDNYSNEVMTFDSWYNYGNDDENNYLKLLYSFNYPGIGDPTGSTWSELTFDHPTSSSTWTTSGNIDLSAIAGTSVYIAYKYHYEVGNYRAWEIDNISITEGIESTVTITSPNGGESWTQGASYDITWESTQYLPTAEVWIYAQYNYGLLGTYAETAITNYISVPNTGTYTWNVSATQPIYDDYKIFVEIYEASLGTSDDLSDDYFSIIAPIPPSITVTSPNGGESYEIGTEALITWDFAGFTVPGTVQIDILAYGIYAFTLIASTPNDGEGSGLIPDEELLIGDNYKVKITSNEEPTAFDESDEVFSIIAPIVVPDFVIINEVDADQTGTDSNEFIELYDGGVGNTALDGLVVVMFNGSDDQSYLPVVDLDGYTTDANGYFVMGSATVPNVDLVIGTTNIIQNGADAVALYAGNADDFPNDTPITTDNLFDALVYDTNDADDPGLLPLLNAGQPQINENGNGAKDTESNQRIPNGAGGGRNTDTYAQATPTPGAENQAAVVLDAPTNVQISHDGTDVAITWDAVTGATSYIVESCDTPDGTFIEETGGTFVGESWNKTESVTKKFYQITAVN